MDRRDFTLAAGAFVASGALVPLTTAAQTRTRQGAPTPRLSGAPVVDALAIGGAGSVEGPEVLAAGMDALVLDLTIFPRAPAQAATGLEAWNAVESARAVGCGW